VRTGIGMGMRMGMEMGMGMEMMGMGMTLAITSLSHQANEDQCVRTVNGGRWWVRDGHRFA